jgi:uncharacterized MAPEG superfamily protein
MEGYMTFELQVVVWTTVLLLVLIMYQGAQVPINQGFGCGLGNRDEKQEFPAWQMRTGRTIANHIEGMLLFVPLVVVAHMAELSSALTVWGSGIYLAGRVGFAVLYLVGVPIARSAAWGVSLIGILMIASEVIKATL